MAVNNPGYNKFGFLLLTLIEITGIFNIGVVEICRI